jgi:hypothetical protein
MIRVIFVIGILLFSTRFGKAGPTEVRLKKAQLGALSAVIHQMQQIGRSYKGQQVVIEDKGNVFHVTFMNDPIDTAIAGNQGGMSWEVRKKDLKVLGPLVNR